jgi:xanthosine utilization system XapX-like protein
LGLGIIFTVLSQSLPLFLASSAIGLLSIYLGTRKIEKKPANSQNFTIELNSFKAGLILGQKLTL